LIGWMYGGTPAVGGGYVSAGGAMGKVGGDDLVQRERGPEWVEGDLVQ
jgi:hypothetical protein